MKSALEVIRKYRSKNEDIKDDYYQMKKHNIKVENFSSLFFVMEDETSKAYYNPHLHLVLIINNGGYIDNIIYLYDRKMKFFDSANIDDKLKIILNNYYYSTKYNFIESLYENGFISYFLFNKLKKECI